LGGRYGVFEVVGYGVYREGAGFLEEFGGGGGDYGRVRSGGCEMWRRGSTVEEGAAEDGGCFGGHFVSIRLCKHNENRGHYSMFKIRKMSCR
jgi:hypothetical protein